MSWATEFAAGKCMWASRNDEVNGRMIAIPPASFWGFAVHHMFAGLGSAVLLFPPSTWCSTGIALASAGAVTGTVTIFRSR